MSHNQSEYLDLISGPRSEFGWELLKLFDILVEIDEISWEAIKAANSFRLRRFEPRFSALRLKNLIQQQMRVNDITRDSSFTI